MSTASSKNFSEGIELYLVRHGEAHSTPFGRLSSYPEGTSVRHLTARGKEQVRHAAEALRGEGISLIIASPLERTKETAALLSETLRAPVCFDIRLRETDFGRYNGLPLREFFTEYPDQAARERTTGADGVEGFSDIRARVASLLSDIFREHRRGALGNRVALVSHQDTLEALFMVLCPKETPWRPRVGEWRRVPMPAVFDESENL